MASKVSKAFGFAVVVTLAGTGCGGSEEPSTEPSAPVASPNTSLTPKPPVSSTGDEEKYLSLIKAYGVADFFTVVPDDELVTVGRSVCESLDSGISMEDYTKSFYYDLGGVMGLEDISMLLGTSIGSFCPEYIGDLGQANETLSYI